MNGAASQDLDSSGFVVELEQEVLGAVLITGQYGAVQGRVRPEHFLEPLNRRIFENIQDAGERFKTATPNLVFNLFPVDEVVHWNKTLGLPLSAYLANLAGGTVHGVAGLSRSVPNLIQQWARLSVRKEAALVAIAAASGGASPIDLIRDATRSLDDISSGMKAGGRGKTRYSINEAADAALVEVEC